jgi:type I restriction enzyme S subunit
MSFPRYPAYKDSGVEWLGEVPEHWEVKRLKQVCTVFPSNIDKKSIEGEICIKLCNYTDVYYNDYIGENMDFMEATATAEQIRKFSLTADDTIITKDSETADDIAIAAYVPKDLPGVICGYHLSMVRPNGDISGAFVKRFFDSAYAKSLFAVRANGLTRVGLSQYAIDNVELPLPPREEQSPIATFLDHETAKIDALIAEQQRLIELLQEKRQAVISHAVTKGLNPDAPMKDSGVEWLGEVPEHWSVLPVWMLFFLGRGREISHEDIAISPGVYPVYSSQTERDGEMGKIDTYDFEGDYLTWTTDGANAGSVFQRSGRFNCTNVCGTLRAKSSTRVLLDFALQS